MPIVNIKFSMTCEVIVKKVGNLQGFHASDQKGGINGLGVASIGKDGNLIIGSIHVIPAARRRGVGASILDAIKKYGKECGAKELTGDFFPEFRGGKDEAAARKFYRKHGIEITSEGKLKAKL